MKAAESFGSRTIGRLLPRAAPWLFPLLIVLHNPRRVLAPEMWGEDGPVWYAEAYQFGLASLAIPAGGYLNSVQRLVAIAAQFLPVAWAPLFFQVASVLIQAAPAVFLVSRRMDAAWPDRASRCLFALLYLVMPNAPETAMGLTNSQWYLAILAFLLIVSTPPAGLGGRVAETLVLLVAGASGPFCVLLMPAALWELLAADRVPRREAFRRAATLAAMCLLQGTLILSAEGRNAAPLGATLDLFLRIFSLIGLGATLGFRSVIGFSRSVFATSFVLPYFMAAASAMLIVMGLAKGPRILAQFTIFAAGVFGLALIKPLISTTDPQWPLMLSPPSGNRYFLFPMLAWWGALFVLAGLPQRGPRIAGRVLLAITVLVAVPRDWGDVFALPATDFIARAREFDAAPPGTVMEFHIQPPRWKFSLTKK